MPKIKINRLAVVSVLMLLGLSSYAQDGAVTGYSPYSIFGVGNINQPGTAYSKSMGGVGIASRHSKYINLINPAAVTARDSLSVLMDFSVFENNSYYTQNAVPGNRHSANNSFNINNIAISFPIYKSSAMMFGVAPYSSTGYKYHYSEKDPYNISMLGTMKHEFEGTGSTYQLFATGGVTFWKSFSVGIEYSYIFGNIKKNATQTFSDASVNAKTDNIDLQLRSNAVKLGLQYEKNVSEAYRLCLGATYKMNGRLGGYVTAVDVDTLKNDSDVLRYGNEIGFGVSVAKRDKWRLEADYRRSDWTGSKLDGKNGFAVDNSSYSTGLTFRNSVSDNFMLGFEFVPNATDIRYYFKRCTYRSGLYYRTDYFTVGGNGLSSRGLTFGITFPVNTWGNGMTFTLDLGQRGGLKNGMVRENYINFCFGANILDIWFQKHRYE